VRVQLVADERRDETEASQSSEEGESVEKKSAKPHPCSDKESNLLRAHLDCARSIYHRGDAAEEMEG